MPEAAIIFLLFMGIASIVLFNLMTAIVVKNAFDASEADEDTSLESIEEMMGRVMKGTPFKSVVYVATTSYNKGNLFGKRQILVNTPYLEHLGVRKMVRGNRFIRKLLGSMTN